ncbi:hypothetical protein EII17_01485 [Clostridiales bacterium COT073_COT-073]|nr:hypothetical protein EII17_01485 [Clostridiales bacterium COT073_COT-073]
MEGLQIVGVIILVIGILFMMAEIFVPSFGIAGGIGFLAMTLGIVLTAETFAQGLLYFVIMLCVSVGFLILGYFVIGNSKIALKAKLNEDPQPDYRTLLGACGKTLSPLRPSGTVEINGYRFDVLTQSEFIGKDEAIRVIAIQNNHIIVGRA